MHLSTSLTLYLSSLALATHLRVKIPSSQLLPHPNTLPSSTHASLTTLGTTYTAPLSTSNDFDFRNITSGSYLLDIHCHTYAFAPLRVDIHELSGEPVNVWGTFRGNEWDNKGEVVGVEKLEGFVGGERSGNAVWGFDVRAAGGKEYLVQKEGFSPLGLLKNPMILIAGFSMLIIFGMPYLMENMDPEMKEEFLERQKTSALSGNPAANPLQNFDAAAWLSGASTKSETKRVEGPKAGDRGVTR